MESMNVTLSALATSDLVALYNSLTNKSIKKFESREKAISQTAGAAKVAGAEVVAATCAKLKIEAAAPKAESKPKPEPKAKAEPKAKPEPKAKAEPKAKPEPKAKAEPKSKEEPKEGIIAKVLRIKKSADEAKAARSGEPVARRKLNVVKPTFSGTSKVRPTSGFGIVLAELQKHKDGIEVAKLSAKLGHDVRGSLAKLMDNGHAVEA